MTGVLIVAHGSRKTETEDTLAEIHQKVQTMLSGRLIEIAYMEFSEKTIGKGLDLLVQKGVTDILVIPYFLFSGMHIEKDIPDELDAYRKAHPTITVTMGQTLGADDRLAEIVKDRIEACLDGEKALPNRNRNGQ